MKKGNKRMSKTKCDAPNSAPITAQEAIELLQSAIGYLQMAGITVQAQNSPAELILTIPNASYSMSGDGAAAKFNIGAPKYVVPQD
jgi:hypothetical protein